ncbi:sensor domain-containing diguanylate cyclase [Pseudomarimonas arenosa]|uniref:diguanylate cyclase n=1 Tax=Pseudomarimonas arenosa TaxID=2774145 RepID=A0AAW3ZTX6_9GAMM|nr:GGDEF domain-containing protein [Pseudomarimonas arenosa]MBD8528220.1 diguanylate cyclase [Pseudomarimonas arenosa]
MICLFLCCLTLVCYAQGESMSSERAEVRHARLSMDQTSQQARSALEAGLPMAQDTLLLQPGTAEVDWFWLRAPTDSLIGPVLRLDTALVESLQAFDAASGAELGATSYLGAGRGSPLRSSFVFDLPATATEGVLIRAEVPVRQVLSWNVLSSRAQLEADRAAGMIAAAAYAAMLASALASLALTLAVRESVFRFFTAFAVLAAVWLAAADGHLYELPGMAALDWRAIPVLGMACAAAILAFAHRLLGLSATALPLARWSDRAAIALLPLGIVLALLPAESASLALSLMAVIFVLACLAPVLLAAWSWSLGSPVAGVLCVLWLVCLLAFGTRGLALMGLLPASHGLALIYQGAAALGVVGLSVALTDRVIVLRRQAEAISEAHAISSADLALEKQRRQFLESLEDVAQNAASDGDLEWRAFRLLLQSVAELVPAQRSAITATGFRGYDFLLSEPPVAKAHYCELMTERASTLKGICRARNTMQVDIELDVEGGQPYRAHYAVLPLAVSKPGWGALLIERELGQLFSDTELNLAAEFADLALKVIEENAKKAELKRTAEVDPLTGLINRKTGEARLEKLIAAAELEGEPLSLLFIDLDRFQPINQRYGVNQGDQCLRRVADVLRPLAGRNDLLYRHGGDEFLLVLPGASLERGVEVAEHARANLASLRFQSEQGPFKLTASIGAAPAMANDTPANLVDRAERASGSAKGAGRNQVKSNAGKGSSQAPEHPLYF